MKKTLKEKVNEIVEPNKSIESIIFNTFIIVLIILSTISIIISTIPNIKYLHILKSFELFVVIIFTVEYILRVWSSTNKVKTVLSFLGIIDFLAIFPFYLLLIFPDILFDLRILRILRIFRIFRIFKLARYSDALLVLGYVIKEKFYQLVIFIFIVLIILLLVSSFIYFIEPNNFNSIPEAFWWSIVTLTTVGYGDTYPTTILGKIFAGIVMLIGIGLIAIPTGIISSGLTEYFMKHKKYKKCSKCSYRNDIDAKYCKMCGNKL